jgi:hypothetical protein
MSINASMINQIEHETTIDRERLLFRRQFLLTKTPIDHLENWNCLRVDGYYLYIHPDLEVTRVDDTSRSIVLIGSLFDPSHPEKENADIVRDINSDIHNLEDLFMRIKPYVGRYALLYKDDKNAIIMQDAISLREVYYCTNENRVICGSQPNLVAKHAGPATPARCDAEFLEYYAKNSINGKWNPYRKWFGDETFYEGIKHLMPNHFLDINKREARRYWPREPLGRLSLDEAVARSCSFLRGSMKAIVHRHPIMMAVTAGWDSRTLLAASRGIHDKIYFFINNEGLGHGHRDIAVPKIIFESIDVPFHIHEIPQEVDDEFRRIFLNNTFFASERILPSIYNVYFKGHKGKVNILGMGELGRQRLGKEPKDWNSYRVLYLFEHIKEDRYLTGQAEKILTELLPIREMYGVKVSTLVFWEHYAGNWGAVGNSESDIAMEELNPYVSHLLYETLLSVNDKYTNYKNPVLFREMINNMWPQLLDWPVNPMKYSSRGRLIKGMPGIETYHNLKKEIRYQINYLKYLYEARKH